MKHCPYCGGLYKGELPEIPKMTRRQRRIYDAVVLAGDDGILPSDLVKIMVDGDRITREANQVLRVNICYLNKCIAGLNQHIKGSKEYGYHLVRIK